MALSSRRHYLVRASYKGRERSGLDTMYLSEMFQGSTVNTSQWQQSTGTMTIAQSNGITLNSGSDVTSGHYAILQSYIGVGVSGEFPSETSFVFSLAQTPQANNIVEMGVGFVSTTSAPTDGVFLRINQNNIPSNGTNTNCPIMVVVNNNGTEKSLSIAPQDFTLVANTRYKVELVLADDLIEVFINGVCLGQIDCIGSTSLGVSTNAQSWPVVARVYNSGTVTTAQQLTIYQVTSLNGDSDDVKPWSHTAACAGWAAYQGRTGSGTIGQTAQWSNSAQPSSATLSNTAAGYTTLGGKWQFAAVGGAETDYALFAYQNPAGTATVPGVQLHITGVRISTVNNGAAVATTATILEWAIAVGSTAVSLATAQSSSAKAPNRVALGEQGFIVGAAIGATANDIDHAFQTPMVANPGEFVHIILRVPVGTATASEIFRGTVLIEGYQD